MPHISQAGHAAGAQGGTFHDAGIQLNLPVGVQARSYAGVEQRFVFHVAYGRHRRGQGAVADRGPADVSRALRRRLSQRALRIGHRPSAAMDDQGRTGQPGWI
jgi:hypothetical protein